MPTTDRVFRAMGSDCHVLVESASLGDELGDLAQERVALLEQCWSRFRPDSELNRLNAKAGRGPVAVSPDLLVLVQRMAEAWTLSNDLFDPTILGSLTALGYDADLSIVSARATMAPASALAPAPGMSGAVIDAAASTVSLPAGVGIDPGAIGKGLAADLVLADLMSAGATGAMVNLGGDLAFAGVPDAGAWSIGVEDARKPIDEPHRILQVLEYSGDRSTTGIATSTTLKRRWAQGRRHHVIDPRTGTMSASDLVQVTVVAEAAWVAEVTATTALLMRADEANAWLRQIDVPAILITADAVISTMHEEDAHA